MFYLFRLLHSIYKARPDFRTFSHQFSIWAPYITLYAFREFIRKHIKPCFLRHNFLQQGGWDSLIKHSFTSVSCAWCSQHVQAWKLKTLRKVLPLCYNLEKSLKTSGSVLKSYKKINTYFLLDNITQQKISCLLQYSRNSS